MTADQRNAIVRAVLAHASEPMGPSDIARKVGQSWCVHECNFPNSSAIVPVLRRIGAVRHSGGKYTSPAPGEPS